MKRVVLLLFAAAFFFQLQAHAEWVGSANATKVPGMEQFQNGKVARSVRLTAALLEVQLEKPVANLEIQVLDLTGRILFSTQYREGFTKVVLELNKNLASGIYLVRLRADGQEQVMKQVV